MRWLIASVMLAFDACDDLVFLCLCCQWCMTASQISAILLWWILWWHHVEARQPCFKKMQNSVDTLIESKWKHILLYIKNNYHHGGHVKTTACCKLKYRSTIKEGTHKVNIQLNERVKYNPLLWEKTLLHFPPLYF